MKKETILVTGCAGFIGSNFCSNFISQFPEVQIVGIDDLSSGRKESVHSSVVFYEGSITNEALTEKIFSEHKPQFVFHFAAIPRVTYSVEHPTETSYVNICGTIQLLEKSKKYGVKRFILSSSSSVYGGAKILPTKESENTPDPKSPYAGQKLVDEIFCKIFSDLYGLDTICLRYFNVFGPGQYGDSAYSTVISAWLEALYFPKGSKPFIEGDGEQTRDFCYVDNVVSANIKAMESDRKFGGDYFNIAHGERTSVNEVKKLIEEYSGKVIELEHMPPRMGDVRDTHADISKAEVLLGYKPAVNFNDGLRRTVAWFEQRKK